MAKLGEICTFQSGGTPSKTHSEYFGGNIPWVSTTALNGNVIKESDAVAWITPKAIQESAAKIVPANSIMVGTRVGIGKVAVNSVEMSTSQDVISLVGIDESKWHKPYLCELLSSKKDYFNSQARGATIKGIKIDIVANVEIPGISYAKQKHIADILYKVKCLISLRKQQLSKLDELVKARFVEMFGDFKNNSKNWPIVKFDELAKIDGNMTTDYEKYADYPHIGIDSIEKETGELKGYRTVKEDGVVSGKYIFTPQHIIYSKIRPNLNKVALPDFEGLCSADAYPILPNPKNCNRIFLALAMRSDYFLDYILQFSARTNLPKVNRKEIAGFSMPLPPLSLQNDFATFVERVNQQKQIVQQSLEKLELMKKALMQEYFG